MNATLNAVETVELDVNLMLAQAIETVEQHADAVADDELAYELGVQVQALKRAMERMQELLADAAARSAELPSGIALRDEQYPEWADEAPIFCTDLDETVELLTEGEARARGMYVAVLDLTGGAPIGDYGLELYEEIDEVV